MTIQTEPSGESRSQPRSGRRTIVILVVLDVEAAEKQAEESVKQLGGAILKREAVDDGAIVTVSIPGGKEQQLLDRLKRIGELKTADAAGKQQEMKITLEIRMVLRQSRKP